MAWSGRPPKPALQQARRQLLGRKPRNFRNPEQTYLRLTHAVRQYTLQAIPKWKRTHQQYLSANQQHLSALKRFGGGDRRTRRARREKVKTRRELVKARNERRGSFAALREAKGSVWSGLTMDPRYPIFNDRAFNERLFGIFRGGMKGGVPANYSLAVIDIDHLRKINKVGGHPLGDKAIEEICKLAVNNVAARLGGLAARFGGDELKVFAPVGKAAMKEALDRIQRQFNDYYNKENLRFSFSAGVAGKSDLEARHRTGFRGVQPLIGALYELADRATYQAKRRGRARAVVYRPRR